MVDALCFMEATELNDSKSGIWKNGHRVATFAITVGKTHGL